MKKVNKLGKYVRKLDANELKKVSGGVNADEQDRNVFNKAFPGLPGALPGGLPSPGIPGSGG
ncbi:MAG: hypothetical protein K0V04_20715 [Deltaproteobacteria bacterium]|nr:hypothetical protein [Deltaproteobacteria bacterium]